MWYKKALAHLKQGEASCKGNSSFALFISPSRNQGYQFSYSTSIPVNKEENRESGTKWESPSTWGLHLIRIHQIAEIQQVAAVGGGNTKLDSVMCG
jgi:hypothetical protein